MTKRKRNHYTPVEKMGAMLMTLRDGLGTTSKALGIPESTIAGYFSVYGGIIEVRRWIDSVTLASFQQAERSIYEQVIERAKDVPIDELLATFREMAGKRLTPIQPLAGAQAGAHSEVHVWNINDNANA